jgi:glycosyltransferase involved in cell wall biosynthesis
MSEPVAQVNKLCIVTPMHSAAVGGAEYQIDRFIDVLRSRGEYEIYYLSSQVSDDVQADRYHVVHVGNESRPPRFGYLSQAVPLYKALREIQPTTIYQRVACGFTGVCAYYAQQHNARLVWHVAHDSDVTPQESLDGRNPVRRFLEKRSVEYGIRRASCIVTQTTDQATLLERNYRRKANAIIPNFHPLPSERVDKSGELTVAWVAGLKPWKRPEAFLDLANALQDLHNVRFVMVGPEPAGSGDKSWAGALLRRIRATANVDYRGGRTQTEVNELLARSHVFVNTSDREGFPNTFIQAWMREAAVVSLDVDPDRLLEQAGIGIFCGGSRERLADSVRSLLSNSATREQYAAKAREYALARHSLANAEQLVRLLNTEGTVQ